MARQSDDSTGVFGPVRQIDVDIGAREQPERCGLTGRRIEPLNVEPALIDALAVVARRTPATTEPLGVVAES